MEKDRESIFKDIEDQNVEYNIESYDFGALHIAVEQENYEFVKACLQNNENKNAQDEFGRTALHIAYMKGNLTIIDLLLRNALNANALDYFGKEPFDYFDGDSLYNQVKFFAYIHCISWSIMRDFFVSTSNTCTSIFRLCRSKKMLSFAEFELSGADDIAMADLNLESYVTMNEKADRIV